MLILYRNPEVIPVQATVGQKNSFFTERNLKQDQAHERP